VEMRRHFAGYIAFGVALWIGMQSFVSIGVNLGMLPTKGLTLPLVSSGGSSVMMTCVAIGLLLRVSYELDRAERQRAVRQEAAPQAAADTEPVSAPVRATTTRTASHVAPQAPAAAAPHPAAAALRGRGTSRVEPTFGGFA
jgi:cell division protein FtsW